MAMASNNSGHELNEDVRLEILKRLPVKTIGRFECVCKSWKSLITSSFFTNLHLYFNSSLNPNNSNKPYTVILTNTIVKNEESLSCPFRLSHYTLKFTLTGVLLHGIVYLTSVVNSNSVLWNPSIRKYLIIPPSPYSSSNRIDRCIGFGFDSLKNDFKVVRITLHPTQGTCRCDIFSVRKRVWRSVVFTDHIGPFSPTVKMVWGSTFHNGFIYWVTKTDDFTTPMILVFDCEREELKTMDLPPEFNNSSFKPWYLSTYYGMLYVKGVKALWDNVQGDWKAEKGYWVMEEDYKWKKLDTIKPNGKKYIFQPSLLLMDQDTKAESYNVTRDRYGKVSYIKDGTQCDYIQVPFT